MNRSRRGARRVLRSVLVRCSHRGPSNTSPVHGRTPIPTRRRRRHRRPAKIPPSKPTDSLEQGPNSSGLGIHQRPRVRPVPNGRSTPGHRPGSSLSPAGFLPTMLVAFARPQPGQQLVGPPQQQAVVVAMTIESITGTLLGDRCSERPDLTEPRGLCDAFTGAWLAPPRTHQYSRRISGRVTTSRQPLATLILTGG